MYLLNSEVVLITGAAGRVGESTAIEIAKNGGMKGPDHKASLDVKGFSSMVKSLRNTYLALGNSLKEITYAEKENILIVRKSLVALKRIKKGELFTMQNLGIKRPGNGVSPMKYYEYLGNISMKDYDPNEVI